MDGSLIVYDREKEDVPFTVEDQDPASSDEAPNQPNSNDTTRFHIHKSVHSKNQKCNPVSCWKLASQAIHALAFAPDSRHLAIVSEDGTLHVLDYLKEM